MLINTTFLEDLLSIKWQTRGAMEMGEVEGAMSSLAIVVCGLCTVIGASVFAGML